MLRRTAIVVAMVLTFGLEAGLPIRGQTVRLEGAPPALQAVLADAAARSGADRQHLQLLRTERVDWSDGGLGCPQPGELYSPVMTPGWLIEVRSGGKVLEYHADSADHVVFCAER